MIELDKSLTVPNYSAVCMLCKHYRPEQGRACAAFPKADGIPLEIWTGENKHTTPVAGDHGIQFESVEGS